MRRLTAGSGYDYLTRQVAAMDSSEKGHVSLASYYSEKGEVPGRWIGSGMAGIDGLNAGDIVTAEQMQALFGAGMHPLAQERSRALQEQGATSIEILTATRLGTPFNVYDSDIGPFRIEVARRLQALNRANGLPANAPASITDRARVRSEVALEMFVTEHRRAPLDVRELTGFMAKLSRQQTTAVAGFDLTFSPVKSVSALWALAEPHLAARIERAHHAAVADALRFIETQALFTRTGRGGIRQVDVRGLVAAAFTHRDSRAGDPDLHTHVAVANKVQTLTDGRWLSIDSRVLHKAIVAASETYNTALERHLADDLGLRFAERAQADPRKRPIREIVGVDPRLIERWSTRRKSIEARRRQLVAAFQRDHGRPPTPVEAIALAEQATLETRDAKHEPRTLAEQRGTWRDEAAEVFGNQRGIAAMIDRALHPSRLRPVRLNDAWVDATAEKVVHRVEQDRSVWQSWHLIGEAQRLVRAAAPTAGQVPGLVDRVVERAARVHSVALGKPDPISEPAPLRRSDGSSVYRIAGSQHYTSRRILDAEQRLITAAGRRNGRSIPGPAVDLAVLQSEADGVPLNAGQGMLVREMATSRLRVQLAIAPAGSGKTTAMNALAKAWANAGGTVLGLAPSATAAATLSDQIGAHADTLAKLVWSLDNNDHPTWLKRLGRKSLVIIDEAGMAGTLTLDTVISHVLAKGASVRLIGDDQQLAAIEAGGVLRDIEAEHGALRLTELVRFADQAEGSASLALRDGLPEALGFYLDNHRVHVGDETTMADDLFTAWATDRAAGLDSIMLAPTREQVAELNQRARTQRLNGQPAGVEVELADGNRASVGDVILTRTNNRKLRTSATDWVKNGDRWTVLHTDRKGRIQARHVRTGRHVTLPADYVAESVELGYASTTHAAQGITADTMHGLLAGSESRQQAYTMLTRGRIANHSYLVTVGDGDPHNAIDADVINPLTPTDLLERILGRDEACVSATTQLREAGDPRGQLRDAVDRYSDAIAFAATHTAGDIGIRALERQVEAVVPGLTESAGWPALQSELLMIQADGRNPSHALSRACADPINTAHDPASVLAWRIADHEWRGRRGPLPWLPAVPTRLEQHPLWGGYLTVRAGRVNELADAVSEQVSAEAKSPRWLSSVAGQPPASLVADVEVWRAAHGIPGSDQRPTGDRQHPDAAARWQRQLDKRLQTTQSAALDEWGHALTQISPTLLADPFTPTLARRLSQLSASGVQACQLLHHAADAGPLPDDHAAAALWWRIFRHVSPAVAEDDSGYHLAANWLRPFTTALGPQRSSDLQASSWWPSLVATIERGLQRGWALDTLLADAQNISPDGHVDRCQAWVWRLSLLTDPIAPDEAIDTDQPPTDLWDGYTPAEPVRELAHRTDVPLAEEGPPEELEDVELTVEAALAIEAMIRNNLGLPEPTDADIRRMQDRANAWHDCPATPERLAHINELTARYYERCFSDSWARPYLIERFHQDLAGSIFRPGYAPDGWTGLVTHLRRQSVTDEEMLAAGVAATASTGRLIDRFRDRVVFPITHEGQVLGFVGRRNPTHTDEDQHGPKYLNTPDTPLFHKGAQLFAAGTSTDDATPVLVEGPMDAIAVTLASDGKAVGLAALGTSLTSEHARQLRDLGRNPVLATDADRAGQMAAERAFWLLTAFGIDPLYARLPDRADPADLVANAVPDRLTAAIGRAETLARHIIDGLLERDRGCEMALGALRIVAAEPPARWASHVEAIASMSQVPAGLLRSALVPIVRAWNTDPRHLAGRFEYQAVLAEKHSRGAAHEKVTLQHADEQPSGVSAPGTSPRR